ncbi:hypothetical protein APHAL10511_000602 [Amanita phalloides]|nr:hypothetical protein APHAL10511_000602 [Amanita phalloides]
MAFTYSLAIPFSSVKNIAKDKLLLFRAANGVITILPPDTSADLKNTEYHVLVLYKPGEEPHEDLFSKSSIDSTVHHEFKVTNIATVTIVFKHKILKLPDIILKNGQTAILKDKLYDVTTE